MSSQGASPGGFLQWREPAPSAKIAPLFSVTTFTVTAFIGTAPYPQGQSIQLLL